LHAGDRPTDFAALIAVEIDMAILHDVSSSAGRHPALMMLIFGTLGFVLGFLLSLAVAAQSLYVCTEIM
jgi:hypothetical protein